MKKNLATELTAAAALLLSPAAVAQSIGKKPPYAKDPCTYQALTQHCKAPESWRDQTDEQQQCIAYALDNAPKSCDEDISGSTRYHIKNTINLSSSIGNNDSADVTVNYEEKNNTPSGVTSMIASWMNDILHKNTKPAHASGRNIPADYSDCTSTLTNNLPSYNITCNNPDTFETIILNNDCDTFSRVTSNTGKEYYDGLFTRCENGDPLEAMKAQEKVKKEIRKEKEKEKKEKKEKEKTITL